MKKKRPYAIYKRFYERKKKEGWRGTYCFGPPDLVEAVKQFINDYKREHGVYVRAKPYVRVPKTL